MMPLATARAFRSLGVSPDADRATVRKAWRALVRRYHPDQVRGDKVEANRRLAELNSAFDLATAWEPDPRPENPPRKPRHDPVAMARKKARRAAADAAARTRTRDLDARDRAAAARRAARPAPKATPAQCAATRAAQALFEDTMKVWQPRATPQNQHYA